MTRFRGPGARFLTVVLAISFAGSPALAWGPRGHRTVARIASERLSKQAARAVADLLDDGETLVDIANWADREAYDLPAYKDSGPWHFVNVPLDADRYTDRFCKGGGCVVAKIHQFRKILADTRRPKAERRDALRFLVHFVADIHQPLHVGDDDDRGGNNTQVQYRNEGTNLHRLWDSGLIESTRDNDREWADRVRHQIKAEQVKKWMDAPVEDWATESLVAARTAYRGIQHPTKRLDPGTRISREYEDAALPMIEERLARASVRLAHELNGIFGEKNE